MRRWLHLLNSDPISWLLEDDAAAVRHMTLRLLLDRPVDDPEVTSALGTAMNSDPIAAILAAQNPDGYWEKPGPGYATKYRGTVWQVIFLDQLGADRSDPRVRAACEYVLSHTQTVAGGFGASGAVTVEAGTAPPPSTAIHCLNGNLLRALIGLGWLEDERLQRSIDWQARSITGEGFARYYQSGTSGPGFCCAANEQRPCAWGAIKAMGALARVPAERRPPFVRQAIRQGVEFLLSRDLRVADYPFPSSASKPNASWFKLGFPLGYVADVLQNLEVLCALGLSRDQRVVSATEWLLSKQDKQGRWTNQYAYNGKTWADFEKQAAPSKWVTLRACQVLKAVYASEE